MARKRKIKRNCPSSSTTKNDGDNDSLYQKRLRSWKRTSSQPSHKSTIFTYQICHNAKPKDVSSGTVLTECSATESAFFRSSIRTCGDINNNHVAISNTDEQEKSKGQNNIHSMDESFSTQIPHVYMNKTGKRSSREDTKKNIDNGQLIKRSRISLDDSMFMCANSTITNRDVNRSALLVDDCTIDINQEDQQKSLMYPSRSHHHHHHILNPVELIEKNSNSMEAAVKMVQPIVDIIFTAFEEQLKHVQSQIPSSSSSSSSESNSDYSSSFHRQRTPSSSLTSHYTTTNNPVKWHPTQSTNIPSPAYYLPYPVPYLSPSPALPPVTLHAVSFNIQLTTKQRRTCTFLRSSFSEQNLSTVPSNSSSENHYRRSTSLFEFKHKTISSSIPSKSSTFEHIFKRTEDASSKRKLQRIKRFVQLAAFGASVLCGYLFW